MTVPSLPPCRKGLARSTYADRTSHQWVVDCVLCEGHVEPHVTAAGQKFSEGAAI